MKHYSKADDDGLALVGFRLDPNREDPEVYTLIVYGGNDRPVVIHDRIVLFTRPELVLRAYELGDANEKQLGPPPQSTSLVCDIAEMLNIIKNQRTDKSSVILNCINTLLDLADVSGLLMPSEYRSILFDFADHLTFHREFATYLGQKNIRREVIVDAILW
jgi:hypothetical protein